MKVQAYVEGAYALPEKEVFLQLQSDSDSKGADLVLVDRNGDEVDAPYLLRIVVGERGKLVLHRIGCVNREFVEWDDLGLNKIREV